MKKLQIHYLQLPYFCMVFNKESNNMSMNVLTNILTSQRFSGRLGKLHHRQDQKFGNVDQIIFWLLNCGESWSICSVAIR